MIIWSRTIVRSVPFSFKRIPSPLQRTNRFNAVRKIIDAYFRDRKKYTRRKRSFYRLKKTGTNSNHRDLKSYDKIVSFTVTPDDEDSTYFLDVATQLSHYTASYCTIHKSSYLLPWWPRISQIKKSFPVQQHSNRFAKLLYFISSENIKAEYSSWQLSLAVVRKCPLCTSGAEELDKFVCAGVWIAYRQEGLFYVADSKVGTSSAGWAATHSVSFCTHLLKWLIICVQIQRRGYKVGREEAVVSYFNEVQQQMNWHFCNISLQGRT
jgi:hypothetical protein